MEGGVFDQFADNRALNAERAHKNKERDDTFWKLIHSTWQHDERWSLREEWQRGNND